MARNPDGLSLHDVVILIELRVAKAAVIGLMSCCILAAGVAAWGPMIERAAIALKDILGQ